MHRVAYSTCSLSHNSFFQRVPLWYCGDDILFVTAFIGAVHPLCVPPFPLIVLSDKHRYICNSGNISRPIIISYLIFPCKSYTWKFHAIFFVFSSSGSKKSTLLWCFASNCPPWVFQWTGVAFFLRIFCVFVSYYYKGYFSRVQ